MFTRQNTGIFVHTVVHFRETPVLYELTSNPRVIKQSSIVKLEQHSEIKQLFSIELKAKVIKLSASTGENAGNKT